MSATLDADVTGAIEKLIVGSPYGRLLGLACEAVAPDRVRVRLPFRPELATLGELVHGGAIASLVDVAATAAAWATPEATLSARGTTVGFSLSFLAPALGCDLVAEAAVVRRGGSLCTLEVDVSGAGRGSVARALVTYKLSLARAKE
jgi:uncharacterized protein (TIGR00369 family)